MTNREWLNSLSEEELAKIFTNSPLCEAFYDDWCPHKGDCEKCYLEWLRREREEKA